MGATSLEEVCAAEDTLVTSPVFVISAAELVGVVLALKGVTGQTVVETAMTDVTTWVEPAGQLATVEAQLTIVDVFVLKTVEVVIWMELVRRTELFPASLDVCGTGDS